MNKSLQKGFFVFLTAVLISSSLGVKASAITYNYPVTQHIQDGERWCGAAVAQMNIQRITGSLIDQGTIWDYIQANKVEGYWGADPISLACAMAHWTPSGYYYCNWRYTTATGAARGIANNIEQWKAPVSVLIFNGGHWISVNGVDSNMYVPSNYSTATVNGYFCTDPDPWGEGSNSPLFNANVYIDANTFMTQYMTKISDYDYDSNGNLIAGKWNGYYGSVERNANSSYNRGSYIDSHSFSHY